eukprot:1150638-Pelagomonas_calceolata.AAC.3
MEPLNEAPDWSPRAMPKPAISALRNLNSSNSSKRLYVESVGSNSVRVGSLEADAEGRKRGRVSSETGHGMEGQNHMPEPPITQQQQRREQSVMHQQYHKQETPHSSSLQLEGSHGYDSLGADLVLNLEDSDQEVQEFKGSHEPQGEENAAYGGIAPCSTKATPTEATVQSTTAPCAPNSISSGLHQTAKRLPVEGSSSSSSNGVVVGLRPEIPFLLRPFDFQHAQQRQQQQQQPPQRQQQEGSILISTPAELRTLAKTIRKAGSFSFVLLFAPAGGGISVGGRSCCCYYVQLSAQKAGRQDHEWAAAVAAAAAAAAAGSNASR